MSHLTLLLLVLTLLFAPSTSAATPRAQAGASVLRASADLSTVGASWWHNWAMRPHVKAAGFVPTVYGRVEINGLATSGAAGWLMTFNEPNLREQANMSAYDVARGLRRIEQRRPNMKIVSPTIYGDCEHGAWYYSLTDVVQAYLDLYEDMPRFDAIGVHAFAGTTDDAICWIEQAIDEAYGLGYEDAEIWLTEFGCWNDTPDKPEYMRRMLHYIDNTPGIARYAWFPARPVRDSAGYAWRGMELLDAAGQLTELGRIYTEQ